MTLPVFLYIEDAHGEKVEVIRHLPVVIGRSMTCDIKVDRDTVSPRHARLEMGANGLRLVDLASLNGLYVGAKRQTEVVIGTGVDVLCGDLRMEIRTTERLAPTRGLAGASRAATPVHQVVVSVARVLACYGGILGVIAFKQYATYWPPERSVDFFSTSLVLWCMVLIGALFLSLFSKMQNRQYRFVRFVVVLTLLVVVGNVFIEVMNTVVYNARLQPLRLLVQHAAFLAMLGLGLWGLLTTIYPRWRARRHLLTAVGLAALVDAGLSGYDFYEYREGDRQVHDEQVGLPIIPPDTAAVTTAALHGRLTASFGVIDTYRTERQNEIKAEDVPAATSGMD